MVVSISQVIARIKNVLTQTMDLNGIWIQGEISNLTKHRSGHYYFSLKDKSGEMSCVMFSSYVSRLDFNVEEGMSVLVSGSVNIYEQRGSLQLVIRHMRLDGIGDLYLEFEKRKQALENAGYFLQEHKKMKPSYIENIGVVTASQAAALQDVLSTIQKRWPMMKITLYPAYVQGSLAPKSLIRALKNADTNNHDALLIVRGGGSFEDLFCFNDVDLVKTIYDLKTYIVSGVGHEVDTTLCDLVCDHRALTPTAAAQWVSLDQYEVLKEIQVKKKMLISSIYALLDANQTRFQHYLANPYLKDPNTWLIDKKLRVDAYHTSLERITDQYMAKINTIKTYQEKLFMELQNQLDKKQQDLKQTNDSLITGMDHTLKQSKQLFLKNCSLLDAYSPLKILSRGYSISKIENHVVKSISEVHENDDLITTLKDGTIVSKVITKKGA